MAVPLLQFYFFFHASVVSFVAFVLSLFVPQLSFFWCLGKAVLRDWGISWISSLIFLKLFLLLLRFSGHVVLMSFQEIYFTGLLWFLKCQNCHGGLIKPGTETAKYADQQSARAIKKEKDNIWAASSEKCLRACAKCVVHMIILSNAQSLIRAFTLLRNIL